MNSFSVRHWIHNLSFVLAVVVCKASAAAPRRGGCCYSWPLSMYRIQLYLTWHVIYIHLVAQGKKELLNGYWAWDRGNNSFKEGTFRFGVMSKTGWWFEMFFYFHPYLGKWSNLTNIFQMGWNHQLEKHFSLPGMISSPSEAAAWRTPFGWKVAGTDVCYWWREI